MMSKKNDLRQLPRVAAVQMCSSHRVSDNLETAKRLIVQAVEGGASLIVFPEMFAVMGLKPEDKVHLKETEGSGPIQSFLSAEAQRHGVWIVSGTIPLACQNPHQVRAASILYNDRGQAVARYDKIHLFDVEVSPTEIYKESAMTEAGDRITVVDTPFGKLGLTVCYDVRFPELFRYIANQGAEIIAVPSAFTVPTGAAHWELLACSRAVETQCYVMGACQGGTHSSGRKTYGNSVIIDPYGKVIAKKEGVEEGVIFADIDLSYLREVRRTMPVSQHQKIFFDVAGL